MIPPDATLPRIRNDLRPGDKVKVISAFFFECKEMAGEKSK
jgi:hypothetical protein